MKAAYYSSNGTAKEVLKIGNIQKPQPQEGEVLVKIIASGVNPVDGYTRAVAFGPVNSEMIVPGHDGAGIIESVGKNTHRKAGERVWIYGGQWQRTLGTAAEYIALPEHLAIPLPENISYEIGAVLGVNAITAYLAFLTVSSVKNKTVFISGGAGGTSFLAIQLAKHMGAKVITSISSEEKQTFVKKANPDYIINYKTQDIVKEVMAITNDNGVDFIIEINLGANFELNSQILAFGGTITAYGSPGDFSPKLPFVNLLFKQAALHLINGFVIAPDKLQVIIKGLTETLKAGILKPEIWKAFSLDEIALAQESQDANEPIGKIVLKVSDN